MERIKVTEKAISLIQQLKNRYGEVIFYISGGCCEGSQPMCYEKGDFIPGFNSVMFGVIEGCEFYISKDQFKYYEYSELILDAQEGMGGGFSVEAPLGMAFALTSKLMPRARKYPLQGLPHECAFCYFFDIISIVLTSFVLSK